MSEREFFSVVVWYRPELAAALGLTVGANGRCSRTITRVTTSRVDDGVLYVAREREDGDAVAIGIPLASIVEFEERHTS